MLLFILRSDICSKALDSRKSLRMNLFSMDTVRSRTLLLALCCVVSISAAQASPMQIWGYQAWWMGDAWKDQDIKELDRSVFFQLEVGPSGTLDQRHGWPQQWEDWRAQLTQHSQAFDLAITLADHHTFRAVFESTEASDRLQDELTELVSSSNQVGGLHLDVEVKAEQTSRAAISRYRRFVNTLATRLNQLKPSRQLSIFLPSGTYAQIYDAKVLRSVDWVVLQGYDAHFLNSPLAGPVAPLAGPDAVSWEKMLQLAESMKLPRHRLLMSFPLYGYEWTVPSCQPRGAHKGVGGLTSLLPLKTMPNASFRGDIQRQVARHGAQVELESSSLYYLFDNGQGSCTVGWFEDSWSLRIKADWLSRNGLAGLAFFPLGYDKGVLTTILRNHWQRP